MNSEIIETEKMRIADSIMDEIDMEVARAWWDGTMEYQNWFDLDVNREYYLHLVIDIDKNSWHATILKSNPNERYDDIVMEKSFYDDDPCYLMEEMAQWAAEERMKFNN